MVDWWVVLQVPLGRPLGKIIPEKTMAARTTTVMAGIIKSMINPPTISPADISNLLDTSSKERGDMNKEDTNMEEDTSNLDMSNLDMRAVNPTMANLAGMISHRRPDTAKAMAAVEILDEGIMTSKGFSIDTD